MNMFAKKKKNIGDMIHEQSRANGFTEIANELASHQQIKTNRTICSKK